MRVLLSHPTGNANVRAVLDGFYSVDMLHSFHTSVATYPNNVFGWLSRIPGGKDFLKRTYPPHIQSYTKLYPFRELGRMFAHKLQRRSLIAHEKGVFSVDQIYHSIDRQISRYVTKKNGIDAVYAYEDGAFTSFQKARENNIACLYDLPTGYWKAARMLLREEIVRRPEWANTFTGFKDSEEKLNRKDQELAFSDEIYVASTFTANTLKYYGSEVPSVKIIPYGFPPVNPYHIEAKLKRRKKGEKIKLLFVGKLSQQKGIADIFEVIKKFKSNVELTLIGSLYDSKVLHQEIKNYHYLGTMPHHSVLEQMYLHDVLLFPSLFDGFGMVMTEAMSQGTPVIASDRSAGPDIIQHGKNGWLIPAGHVQSLEQTIENIISNPDQIRDISQAAAETAAQRPWLQYGLDIAKSAQEYIQK